MNQTISEASAFAELVRKMALSILRANNEGRYEEATDITLSLLGQATERKRELLEATNEEDNDPTHYDLKTLFTDNDGEKNNLYRDE